MKTRNFFLRATLGTIYLIIGFRIFQIGFRIYSVTQMKKVLGGTINFERLRPIIEEYDIEQTVSSIILAAWIICFLIWFYISYKNVQRKSNHSFSFKPLLALFSLIIPVFNLFAPYKIMREIWFVENRDPSQEEAGKKLINMWWFLSLALFAKYLKYHFRNVEELPDVIRSEYYYIVYYAVTIHYFFASKRLLELINSEQNYDEEHAKYSILAES